MFIRWTRGQLVASALFLSAMLIGASPPPAPSSSPPQSNTANTDIGATDFCSASDVRILLARGGFLYQNDVGALALIGHRLDGCNAFIRENHLIAQHSGNPKTKPYEFPKSDTPANPNCDKQTVDKNASTSEIRAAVVSDYETLVECVQWVTDVMARSNGASPKATPPLPLWNVTYNGHPVKVIYVLASSSDSSIAAQIALTMTQRLWGKSAKKLHSSYGKDDVYYYPVAEPTWTVAQYQQQCSADASTGGAILLSQAGTQNKSWNYAVATGSFTFVGLQAAVLDCEPVDASYVNNVAHVTWVSQTYAEPSGHGLRTLHGFPLATALAIASTVAALLPNKTTSFSYATPPAPPNGQAYESGYSTVTNAGPGLAAAAVVAALTPFGSTVVGTTPGSDMLAAWSITNDLDNGLIPEMQSQCRPPSPPTTATISPSGPLTPNPHPTVTPMTECDWFDF